MGKASTSSGIGGGLVRVAKADEVLARGCHVVTAEGHTLALFAQDEEIYAIDNRCPHMGFPLSRGTVKDGILTCHWHHARFDLASGGTFDLWADDVRVFRTEIIDGELWVDLRTQVQGDDRARQRLREGLERNIPLVLAKSVIFLSENGGDPVVPFTAGLEFGTRYRQGGWHQGLTILVCMMNLVPRLESEERRRALYLGLAAVAQDCARRPPRFAIRPLPTSETNPETLKRWFREFIEVRDSEGAERCVVSALHAGADQRQMADMLFAAATDHRYINIGHPLDFINKAMEALDWAGWDYAESALTSLVPPIAWADRMEESSAWRHPVDLVAILEPAFDELEEALLAGRSLRGGWSDRDQLAEVILGEDPEAATGALLDAVRRGCSEEELAGAVAYCAALRVAHFHTSNEFNDWDTALHTFTFANAVHQGLRRAPSQELLRGVFDATMSVYLDRFLNVPRASLPEPSQGVDEPTSVLNELADVLDQQQQVNESGGLTARYLFSHGDPEPLLAELGRLLLREDRDFHTIQMIEAAFRQFELLRGSPEAVHVLVAASRYLAAHAPTMRAQGQTYEIARRLFRGEHLFEASG